MNDTHDLERQLRTAGERLQRAMADLAPKHQGGEWEEYHAAHREVLRLERQLAAAKGEEYAEPCGFPLKWNAGAPMPHLMVNDRAVSVTVTAADMAGAAAAAGGSGACAGRPLGPRPPQCLRSVPSPHSGADPRPLPISDSRLPAPPTALRQ